ncbi:Hpt domain-containing protein [Sphingomicrobium sp. B8]|uniref:Hpt domain-containing protein n=1 Tax=Sphingomicrobium clamense TaxID=2851013 RepID=A0ABS6V5A0_9SPHN|nr:Hpt domain-containing protein [Sphingomicrobium sp. B8]
MIDWAYFEETRNTLGPGFIRILGYFREDGQESLRKIEEAMHSHDTAALVIPAHTLKGESRQFGAEPLAEVAEKIEMTARHCIEVGRFPDELIPDVVELKKLFRDTIAAFDAAVSPLKQRQKPGGFGNKVANTGFGRAGS